MGSRFADVAEVGHVLDQGYRSRSEDVVLSVVIVTVVAFVMVYFFEHGTYWCGRGVAGNARRW